MTVDELINEMEKEYEVFLESAGLDDSEYMKEERKNNPDCDKVCTANEMTLDILHKYQRIEEVVEKWKNKDNDATAFDSMMQIKEILEYGNDDRYNCFRLLEEVLKG